MQKETNLTVGRWCDRWFYENQVRWSGSTAGGYRNLIYRHILPGIGDIRLAELSEGTVTSFYDSLRARTEHKKRLVRPSAPAALHGRSGPRTSVSLQPGAALSEATSRSV